MLTFTNQSYPSVEAKAIRLVRDSISSVTNPRLFASERGYQGALLAELQRRLDRRSIWPGTPIVEQEYQKQIRPHGLTQRPDIIIHCPFGHSSAATRRHGNYLVIALKLRATKKSAFKDFNKLREICSVLNYPLAVFIDIDSTILYLPKFKKTMGVRIHEFAVTLDGHVPCIRRSAP